MDCVTAPALLLARGWRRAFTGSSAAARDPMLGEYLADLVRPYRVTLREDMLERAVGQSYGEMAAALLGGVLPAGQPIDLLVFAFASPDVVPGRATACYLSHVCPGDPMALALCDAGSAAAFTGLRLVSQYARDGGCRRALLVVAGQSALHYDRPAAAPVPAVNAVVALLCESEGAGRGRGGAARGSGRAARLAAVRQHAGVTRAGLAGLLSRELPGLAAGRPGPALLLAGMPEGTGPPAATALPGAQVIVAPPGQPFTGLWWELAGGLTRWRAERRPVLLAGYDEALGYLSLAAIDAP